ncbi:MAG: MFS transporter [Gemmataceae bacterium]|nr:MFS transporter [Gemmataceae bacterium]
MRTINRVLPGENAVVWTLWLTYGAFYFCRTNISVAVPGLEEPTGSGGLGLTGDEVGWILASLKIAYGLGQLVNGQFAERISPRVLLALGMFGSAALNVLFGLGTSFYFLLFVWAMNGFCQSLGWTPCVRVMANWVPVLRRGHAVGIIGTGYQITLGLTYAIAGQSVELLGWRGALYVPAVLLVLTGLFMLVCLREAPEEQDKETGRPGDKEIGTPSVGSSSNSLSPGLPVSLSECLYWTLYNPVLWLLGLSLGLLNACRYGFIDWGVAHLTETQQIGVRKAALQYFVIGIGAAAGAYLAGWATDRFFGTRRAPMVCLLLLVLGMLSLAYDAVVRTGPLATMVLLVVIGFCIIGPQVLLVGTAPADLAHKGTSAAAAGFVNFLGYMGAATGDVVTGYYREHSGWETAIQIWAAWAFAAAILSALLWNTTSRRVGLLPGLVPRLGGIATLAFAGVVLALADYPLALPLATGLGVACLCASFVKRWAAAGALLVAAAGLLVVFVSFVQSGAAVTWDQTAAMVAYGLTLIPAVMVLVEQKVELCESSSSEPGAANA